MIRDLWYKNSIIYSLDLGSFMDSNGDGIGDFQGLMDRLDHLEALGVDVIWLAPFHPSPKRDNGYDVSDYYGVHPDHGSPGDFVQFIHQAKKRGIKVIIDLVINHTSKDHPWFQDAREGGTYKDWYLWSKKRPPNWDQGMVFPGVQDRTWTRDAVAREYYFHRFYEHQPDLNIDNPDVRDEIQRIIGYWLELGVDGFRVDAVPFIIEHPDVDNPTRKPEMHFEYIEEIRSFVQWRLGTAVLLGEANVLPREAEKYFRDGRGIHVMFNFWVNQRLFYALATGDIRPLRKALNETRELPPTAQWANFLRNHDELDLGRLNDEQRQAVFERFGPEPHMQLYDRGIRRRLGPMLGSRAEEEFAHSLLFALPGTPVIRYGDEIGMGDDLSLPEREAVRTPMQWSDATNGGFSNSRKPVHAVIDEGPYAYEHVNVAKQKRDPQSLFSWMSRMIRLRKECPEIGWGEWEMLNTRSRNLLVLRYDWRGSSVVTIHNFDQRPLDITLKISSPLHNLLTEDDSRPDSDDNHSLVIEPHGYHWYRIANDKAEPRPKTQKRKKQKS